MDFTESLNRGKPRPLAPGAESRKQGTDPDLGFDGIPAFSCGAVPVAPIVTMLERLQIRGLWPRRFASGRASRYYNGFLALVGFLLSPLSWWNDLIVNIPLAYLLASPIAWLWPSSYVPAFVAAYWLTNLLGLLMMDFGIRGLFGRRAQAGSRSRVLAYSLLYTLLILVLAVLGYLPAPLPAPAVP